jgi:DDE family transposase
VQTECNTERFDFQPLAKREVRGGFDGGAITSDAGALLLREVEVKLAGLVERIRRQWPDVQIIVRADSGFCRENLMCWCEDHGVDFIFGLAKNSRLRWIIDLELELARAESEATGKSALRFTDFTYQTRKSWSRARRAADMRANQIRLYLSSISYVLLSAMRRVGLADTPLERAQCSTIRLKLLKVGALVRITVRKVWISFSESYPYRDQFLQVLAKIRGAPRVVLRC